jgi:hypothetical protein
LMRNLRPCRTTGNSPRPATANASSSDQWRRYRLGCKERRAIERKRRTSRARLGSKHPEQGGAE